MRRARIRAGLSCVAALSLAATALAGVAQGHDGASADDGAIDNAKVTHDHHQHGGDEGHLPSGSENVRLVSKLKLKNAVPEKVADVGTFKGYAYLAAWGGATCKYNGVHVVDIRKPASPEEVAFIQAKEGSYPGEGMQTLHIDTPSFDGDILVSNNEKCQQTAGFGGMNIYDVSDPAHPTPLAEGVGDFTVAGQGKKDANEIHSVFAWDAGYVKVDITDVQAPQYLGDTDFADPDPKLLESAGLSEKPEGNAHQAEFTIDNQYVIGVDEDFGPDSAEGFTDDDPAVFLSAQGSDTTHVGRGHGQR
jgi:hypothetical protein